METEEWNTQDLETPIFIVSLDLISSTDFNHLQYTDSSQNSVSRTDLSKLRTTYLTSHITVFFILISPAV